MSDRGKIIVMVRAVGKHDQIREVAITSRVWRISVYRIADQTISKGHLKIQLWWFISDTLLSRKICVLALSGSRFIDCASFIQTDQTVNASYLFPPLFASWLRNVTLFILSVVYMGFSYYTCKQPSLHNKTVLIFRHPRLQSLFNRRGSYGANLDELHFLRYPGPTASSKGVTP